MQFYGLIGEKLGHSLSEVIHRMFFEMTGIEGAYRLIEVERGRLGGVGEAMRLLGVRGMNVTIPYKQAILPQLDEISGEARSVGAVNTICLDNGRLTGYNTDVYGLRELLAVNGVEIDGRTAVLLGGSGGVAQAAIYTLLQGGVTRLYLVSRQPEGRAVPDARAEWIGYEALKEIKADVLVNGTPVGMYPKSGVSPVPEEVVRNMGAVIDTIYNPPETELMRLARKWGIPAANGLYMLVAQAMRAQEIWQNQKIDRALTEQIYLRLKKETEDK